MLFTPIHVWQICKHGVYDAYGKNVIYCSDGDAYDKSVTYYSDGDETRCKCFAQLKNDINKVDLD